MYLSQIKKVFRSSTHFVIIKPFSESCNQKLSPNTSNVAVLQHSAVTGWPMFDVPSSEILKLVLFFMRKSTTLLRCFITSNYIDSCAVAPFVGVKCRNSWPSKRSSTSIQRTGRVFRRGSYKTIDPSFTTCQPFAFFQIILSTSVTTVQ